MTHIKRLAAKGVIVAIEQDKTAAEAEAAQAAIHDSIERARELVSEAKLVIGNEPDAEPRPPAPLPGPPGPDSTG